MLEKKWRTSPGLLFSHFPAPQPVVRAECSRNRGTNRIPKHWLNLQLSDLIRAWATVLLKWTWQQNPEITKCAVWNCCLHFSLVASMEVDCHRDGRAKTAKVARKLHPSFQALWKPHTSCLSLKTKWLVWSLHLFILLAFLWKWSYNKPFGNPACARNPGYELLKALVTSTLFNFLVSNLWLDTTHPSDSPPLLFFSPLLTTPPIQQV